MLKRALKSIVLVYSFFATRLLWEMRVSIERWGKEDIALRKKLNFYTSGSSCFFSKNCYYHSIAEKPEKKMGKAPVI
jgi:hypothetical protein